MSIASLPEELMWVHKGLEGKRARLAELVGHKKAAEYFPSIGYLYQNEYVAVWPEDRLFVKRNNPMPSFHHKEERDDFWALSGCSYRFVKERMKEEKAQKRRESREERYRKIKELQEKGWTQDKIAEELGMGSRQAVSIFVKRYESRRKR